MIVLNFKVPCLSACLQLFVSVLFCPLAISSVVFWFGDLNFRIEDYDIHVVKCAIDSNKLPLLWERDQVYLLVRSFVHSFIYLFITLVPTMSDQQRVLLRGKLSSSDDFLSPRSLSSTWLKTPSSSWMASTRGPFTSPRRTSLTLARTHTTPGPSLGPSQTLSLC